MRNKYLYLHDKQATERILPKQPCCVYHARYMANYKLLNRKIGVLNRERLKGDFKTASTQWFNVPTRRRFPLKSAINPINGNVALESPRWLIFRINNFRRESFTDRACF